uniref:oxaloacetate tautomerase n=1 Tax=Glossina brevipalpis TaxID=37001 RepID=A0A1A9WJN0_9MUSC
MTNSKIQSYTPRTHSRIKNNSETPFVLLVLTKSNESENIRNEFPVRVLRYLAKRAMATDDSTCKDIIKSRNLPLPEEPILFLKPSTSLIQEGQNIIIPKTFNKVAHEVELACVIAKRCKNVSKASAMQFVGGYCLALDMTAQCHLQIARSKGMPWALGKGFDTSTPVSRLFTPDEVSDPHKLKLWLKVNGNIRQRGNTADMIFKIPDIIEYASKHMTLEPFDVILTGTPGGADPVAPGDIIECGMGDLVEMKFNVVAE